MPLNTSAIEVKTKIPNFKAKGEELQREFRRMVRETHKEILVMAKRVVQDQIILSGAVARRRLLNSVSAKAVASPTSDEYLAEIGFKKPASSYAYFANYGRDPGVRPPVKAIRDWARAKGIDPNLVGKIVWSIGQYGTKGHYFHEDSIPIIKRNSKSLLAENVDRFKRSYK